VKYAFQLNDHKPIYEGLYRPYIKFLYALFIMLFFSDQQETKVLYLILVKIVFSNDLFVTQWTLDLATHVWTKVIKEALN